MGKRGKIRGKAGKSLPTRKSFHSKHLRRFQKSNRESCFVEFLHPGRRKPLLSKDL